MLILGIDTSFDDTAAAVVQDTTVLSNVLSSQLPIYQQWGGVVPRLARQSHQENIDATIALALKRAGITWPEIDAIAVTAGPGLAIALEVGIAKAQELAKLHQKPLVAVNHMEGHLLSVLAHPKHNQEADQETSPSVDFPAMAVLISGGHTQFVKVEGIGNYEIVGETQDDAMGEAFDKVGRMLGLGYPAGAVVEQMAEAGTMSQIVFPIPMQAVKSADTSFSGLKTAAMRIIEPLKATKGFLSQQEIADVAYAFQKACIIHLTKKLKFALENNSVNALMVGGGVAANQAVRTALRNLAKSYGISVYFPYTKKLCADNAAMIAVAGCFMAESGRYFPDPDRLDRNPTLRLGQVVSGSLQ